MLGEFFAARESEIDDELLDAPFERLQTVEAKGLTDINFARLGEILGLGTYEGLVDQFTATGRADDDDVGLYRLPRDFRDALAGLVDIGGAARRWVATEELRMDEWHSKTAKGCCARSQHWRAAPARSNASFGTGGRSD